MSVTRVANLSGEAEGDAVLAADTGKSILGYGLRGQLLSENCQMLVFEKHTGLPIYLAPTISGLNQDLTNEWADCNSFERLLKEILLAYERSPFPGQIAVRVASAMGCLISGPTGPGLYRSRL